MGLELRTKVKKITSNKFLLYKNLHNFGQEWYLCDGVAGSPHLPNAMVRLL